MEKCIFRCIKHTQAVKRGGFPIMFSASARLTLSTACSAEYHILNVKIFEESRRRSKAGRHKAHPVQRGWVHSDCPVWRRGGQEVISLISAAPWGGKILRSSLRARYQVLLLGTSGRTWMAESCARGGSCWALGNISVLWEYWNVLPRGVVGAHFLSIFRRHWDNGYLH